MCNSILFIHRKFPYGGAEKVTVEIANYLSFAGWNVAIVTQELYLEYFPDNTQMFFCLKTIPQKMISKEERNRWVAELINKEKTDVVVCKDEWTIDICFIKTNTSAKIVFHHHSVPYWETITIYKDTVNAYANRKNPFIRLKFLINRNQLKKKISQSVRRYYFNLLGEVDGFVTLCMGYKEIIDKETHGRFREKIYSIYNSCKSVNNIDVERKNEILYVGHLSFSQKRVDRLLRIWQLCQSEIPDWTLRIIGDGPDKESLIRMSKQMELKNVIFQGWIKDVTPFYLTAVMICLTSEVEGWGLVLAEGQCCGVIPIAFDISDGIREILAPNGVNGILIDDSDEKKYASELVRLAKDNSLQKKMREQVIKKSEDYSLDNMGKCWLRMLATLMK